MALYACDESAMGDWATGRVQLRLSSLNWSWDEGKPRSAAGAISSNSGVGSAEKGLFCRWVAGRLKGENDVLESIPRGRCWLWKTEVGRTEIEAVEDVRTKVRLPFLYVSVCYAFTFFSFPGGAKVRAVSCVKHVSSLPPLEFCTSSNNDPPFHSKNKVHT